MIIAWCVSCRCTSVSWQPGIWGNLADAYHALQHQELLEAAEAGAREATETGGER